MAATLASGFLDRTSEREVLAQLLAHVREGQSGVLVIRGEAGIGKTALLRYAARQASGFRVAQVTGVEAEMELPFAGIHQLCAPLLDQLDALPQPQRDALNVALGLSSRSSGASRRTSSQFAQAQARLRSSTATDSPGRTERPSSGSTRRSSCRPQRSRFRSSDDARSSAALITTSPG
jgi:ABC-type nitrate/sulfonate/bicarbonate transport system ATPase subunit